MAGQSEDEINMKVKGVSYHYLPNLTISKLFDTKLDAYVIYLFSTLILLIDKTKPVNILFLGCKPSNLRKEVKIGIREESLSIDFRGNDILRDFDTRCQIDLASRLRQRFRC
jgi:hypothetical protein